MFSHNTYLSVHISLFLSEWKQSWLTMNDRVNASGDLEAVGKSPKNDSSLLGNAASSKGAASYYSYPSRWFMLFLFVMYSTSNAFQWTQLVIITNILVKYYGVSTSAVSWTSMIFCVTYIPLIFPASWFLQKKVMSFNQVLNWLFLFISFRLGSKI